MCGEFPIAMFDYWMVNIGKICEFKHKKWDDDQ